MLKDLLYKTNVEATHGDSNIAITGLQTDSRVPNAGGCFIAIKGLQQDGHDYIQAAIQQGAVAVVCAQLPSVLSDDITYIQVKDPAEAAGMMAHSFHGAVTEKLKLVGVTGTNGKTTVATLLFDLFTSLGYVCGLVSTVENRIGKEILPSTHTTPDAIRLNQLLADMRAAGCSYIFMECSSHAIDQKRLSGLHFSGAIFTNITHDHLDYHVNFDNYIKAKKAFFDQLSNDAFAISNADDKRGAVMLQNTKAKKHYFSLKTIADFKGKILDNSLQGLHMMVNDSEVYFKMIGEFNAYNLLAVYGAAVTLKMEPQEVLLHLSKLTGAEGRFDYMLSDIEKVVGIVDYAHTPDALLNVLATLKKLRQGHEKIITVVGCGGNRDKTKRAVMGEVACEHSDNVIFTSDNPRGEKPEAIIQDMEEGVKITSRKKYISIPNRREAIKAAVGMSRSEDIVLVAGKGHEKYQEIDGVKTAFDDKAVLKEMFEIMEK